MGSIHGPLKVLVPGSVPYFSASWLHPVNKPLSRITLRQPQPCFLPHDGLQLPQNLKPDEPFPLCFCQAIAHSEAKVTNLGEPRDMRSRLSVASSSAVFAGRGTEQIPGEGGLGGSTQVDWSRACAEKGLQVRRLPEEPGHAVATFSSVLCPVFSAWEK